MDVQGSTLTAPMDASTVIPNSARSEKLSIMSRELSEAFAQFMIGLFTILAMEATETGNALLVKHNGFLIAAVLISFVKLSGFVLSTVLQLDAKTRSLIVAELVLGSSISILASFVISFAMGWVTLSLWLCVLPVFLLVIIKNRVKLISSIDG